MGLTDKKSRKLKQTVFLLVRYYARLMDAAALGLQAAYKRPIRWGNMGLKLKSAGGKDTWVVWVW